MTRDLTGPEKRELEALRVFMETASYPEAAERLGITYASFQNLLARMRKRYGVAGSTVAIIPRLPDDALLTLGLRRATSPAGADAESAEGT